MLRFLHFWSIAMLFSLLTGCASHPPMKTVDSVDLQRFMGDWYVIANIPTFLEKDIYNAVERYDLNDDGTVATTFSFRRGGFDGELKTYTPKGFIQDSDTNALWGMQFIWPIKADYRIVYLTPDYSTTVIARKQRDYVWLMARTPTIPDEEFQQVKTFIQELGYDVSKLRKVPQQPSAKRGARP